MTTRLFNHLPNASNFPIKVVFHTWATTSELTDQFLLADHVNRALTATNATSQTNNLTCPVPHGADRCKVWAIPARLSHQILLAGCNRSIVLEKPVFQKGTLLPMGTGFWTAAQIHNYFNQIVSALGAALKPV